MRRVLALLALLLWGGQAAAQSALDWGRIALFGTVLRSKNADGSTYAFNELDSSVTVHTPPRDSDGFEFSLDARGSEYPSVTNQTSRLTIYDAWVGGRIADNHVALRLGQMYVNDLGSLGGVGGVNLETKAGKVRFGLFGGLEPKGFDAGYVPDVRKGGVYVAYEVARGWRVWAGYYKDKNNSDSIDTNRWQFGFSSGNVFGSGFDVFVSDNRTLRPGASSYDAWYFSLGRSLGSRFYVTLDYSTSLSVLQLTDSGGLTIVNRPSSRRYSLSGVWNMTRSFSVLATGERLDDDTSTQYRAFLGLSFRF